MSNLKYLFAAVFEDGGLLEQTQDDISMIDSAKSAFHDVKVHPSDLVSFSLRDWQGINRASINVKTGKFSVDGTTFTIPPERELAEGEKRHLIYFRNIKRHFNIADFSLCGVEMTFTIGYQYRAVDGLNYQNKIAIE